MQIVGCGDQHCIGKLRTLEHMLPSREELLSRNVVFTGVTGTTNVNGLSCTDDF